MSSVLSRNPFTDVTIVGAGIIGLSIAMELHRQGARVTVLESGLALRQASIAAAGMLAVDDPHNPVALLPLSRLSASLYPGFLYCIEQLSGIAVPFQTATTVQHHPDGRIEHIAENSLDPRQLAVALLAAVRATNIRLLDDTTLQSASETPNGLRLSLSNEQELFTDRVVFASGAWAHNVSPRKGQMLRVALPLPLSAVHRNEHIYIVPRTAGPQAGTAVIGATVEDAGFDTTVHTANLKQLRALAAELIPSFADETTSPVLEAWAGLRPATPDALPLLGILENRRHLIAGGHFRNGILLAPATAQVIADLLQNKPPAVSLEAFAPQRFPPPAKNPSRDTSICTTADIRPFADDKPFIPLQ